MRLIFFSFCLKKGDNINIVNVIRSNVLSYFCCFLDTNSCYDWHRVSQINVKVTVDMIAFALALSVCVIT